MYTHMLKIFFACYSFFNLRPFFQKQFPFFLKCILHKWIYWGSVIYKPSFVMFKCLFLPCSWNLSFAGIWLLCWQLVEDLLLLLIYITAVERSAGRLIIIPLEVICLFSLLTFMISSLYLVFHSFTMMYLSMDFFFILVLDLLYFLNLMS